MDGIVADLSVRENIILALQVMKELLSHFLKLRQRLSLIST